MRTSSIFPTILTLGILLSTTTGTGTAGDGQQLLPAVTVEAVRTIDRSEPQTFIGTVSGAETVEVVARVSGTLWKVAFEEGATVREGDVLFEIEDTVYRANVQAAEAMIKQAEANLKLAERDHERNTNLLAENAISKQTFDTTHAAQLLQEARVEEAKANLILKQHDLAYCRITSPITGRIGEKRFSEGNYITPASGTLATIVQYQPIRVQFSVSEKVYFQFFDSNGKPKDSESTIVRANGEAYTGATRVQFVDNLVDSNTDTIMITLECDNPDDQLLPGGFVQVRVAEKFPEPLSAVPVSALMTDGKSHFVFVANEESTVERRTVEIGHVVGRYQTVLAGLTPGETVVIGGMNKVAPGAKIKAVFSNR